MYVNLRRYPGIAASKDAIERSVREDLLPELQRQTGFEGYCAFWDAEGAGVSVSVFDDQEAAHGSTAAARRWVMRNQDLFPQRGEEFAGACIAYEAPRGAGRQGEGEAQRSPYVLIRELDNLPGTQDTRAFVQQRMLPMITRSPGFRGVYTLLNNRDAGRAAVVTFFDVERHAVDCHARALELLKEGLPCVAVTRVVQGQSLTFVTGE